ncbi:hypothetical protein E8E14_002358 [Neopestalotiopsis sp. 37M]|nr:hypothetical protein E8E14_002358 [Neopestalotiopsis sp. 37M]
MSRPYIYDALPENQIRLLSVTASDSAPHAIVLDLHQVALEGAKYTALSYTWGRPEPLRLDPSFDEGRTYELQCGGGFVSVRQSLFDFLQQAKAFDHPLPLLWIDALCINQEDLDERSKQVSLMSKIYTSAQHVWVWLGARDFTKGALHILDEFIPAVLRTHLESYRPPPFQDVPWISYERLIEETVGSDSWSIWSEFWPEYVKILQRCWFSRGWTIQEVAREDLSSIVVFFGPRKYPWEELYKFIKLMNDLRWNRQFGKYLDADERQAFEFAGTRPFIHSIIHEEPMLYEWTTPKQKWYAKVLETVKFLAKFSVSDERDKLFAYLGMLLQSAPHGLDSAFTPDYSLSVEETYVKFTEVLVREMYSLDVLSLAGIQEECEHKNTPSWVPDYTKPSALVSLALFQPKQNMGNQGVIMPEVDVDRLCLRGSYISTVEDMAPLCEFHDFVAYILDVCLRPQHDQGTVQSMPKAVWYLMTAGIQRFRGDDWETHFRRWLSWRYWVVVRSKDAETERGANFCAHMRKALSDLYPGMFHFDEIEQSDQVFDDHLPEYQTMFLRRICTTTDGRLVAGPRGLQPDEEVWILDKGSVFYLLRRSTNDETYRLVGECNFQGMMVEELMTEAFMSSFKPVVLV